MEKEYTMPWGSITTKENGFFICPNFTANIRECLIDADVFETDDGHKGARKNGQLVMPPVLDQFEILPDGSVYIRRGEMCATFGADGRNSMGDSCSQEDGEFIENGKTGYRRNGRVIFAPEYDEISKWYGYDVFRLVKDDKTEFLSSNGERLFEDGTFYQRYSGDEDHLSFTMLLEDGPHGERNVIMADDGRYARVGGITKAELNEIFVNPSDDLKITPRDLKLFNDYFAYEFSVYKASSSRKNAVDECLGQLRSMDVDDNTWHYILRVDTAPGCNLTAKEIDHVRKFFRKDVKRTVLSLHIAVGHDDTLKPGSARMVLVTHYHERCWPADFEFNWQRESLGSKTYEEFCAAEKRMLDAIDEGLSDEKYREGVTSDQYTRFMFQLDWKEGRSWEETEKMLDAAVKHTDIHTTLLAQYMGPLACGIKAVAAASEEEISYASEITCWMLSHGAQPNRACNGSTALDTILSALDTFREESPKRTALLKVRECLVAHGAKTAEQLKAEDEAEGPSYEKSLARLGSMYDGNVYHLPSISS